MASGPVRRGAEQRNRRHKARRHTQGSGPKFGKETVAMSRSRTLALVLLCLGLAAGRLRADAPRAGEVLDAAALAARIDAAVNARLAERGVKPAPRADDAEFLRRVSLDLTGR